MVLAVYILGPLAMLLAVVRRRAMTPPAASLAVGMAAAAMVCACPLLGGEYFHRLSLMAPVPLGLALITLTCTAGLPRPVRGLLGLAAAGAAVASLAGRAPMHEHAQVDDAALAELRSLARFNEHGTKTLVVARHGLQYWAAYFMHAAGRLERIPDDARQKYTTIYILQERGGRMGMRGPSPGADPSGPLTGDRPTSALRGRPIDDLGPPTDFDDEWDAFFGDPADAPPPRHTRPANDDPDAFGPRRGPGTGGPGMGVAPGGPFGGPSGGRGGPRLRIPDGSKTVFQGEHYTLWEVPKDADLSGPEPTRGRPRP
jgi:hypothetical protein